MQYLAYGIANAVTLDAVARSDGSPITAGTVNFYLYRISTGKWWVDSSSTWADTATVAKAGTHVDDGHWIASLKAGAWLEGEVYLLYIKESGDLHIPQSEFVLASVISSLASVDVTHDSTIISHRD